MIDTIDWNAFHQFSPQDTDEANLICDVFEASLNAIAESIEKENHMMHLGQIEEALCLLDNKQKQSVDYARASDIVRRNLIALTRLTPARLAELKDRQIALNEELSENAKLILTLRSLSENLLRGVAQEAHTKSTLTTYGQNGKSNVTGPRRAAPGIIVSTNM